MREDSPMRTTGHKGLIRARMWQDALDATEAGRVRATELRGSDYFGPLATPRTSWLNELITQVAKGRVILPAGRADALHTWTYQDDVGALAATLATDDRGWGRVWHVPSAPARTLTEAAADVAAILGRAAPPGPGHPRPRHGPRHRRPVPARAARDAAPVRAALHPRLDAHGGHLRPGPHAMGRRAQGDGRRAGPLSGIRAVPYAAGPARGPGGPRGGGEPPPVGRQVSTRDKAGRVTGLAAARRSVQHHRGLSGTAGGSGWSAR